MSTRYTTYDIIGASQAVQQEVNNYTSHIVGQRLIAPDCEHIVKKMFTESAVG